VDSAIILVGKATFRKCIEGFETGSQDRVSRVGSHEMMFSEGNRMDADRPFVDEQTCLVPCAIQERNS